MEKPRHLPGNQIRFGSILKKSQVRSLPNLDGRFLVEQPCNAIDEDIFLQCNGHVECTIYLSACSNCNPYSNTNDKHLLPRPVSC